jgi:hypothetical protein
MWACPFGVLTIARFRRNKNGEILFKSQLNVTALSDTNEYGRCGTAAEYDL